MSSIATSPECNAFALGGITQKLLASSQTAAGYPPFVQLLATVRTFDLWCFLLERMDSCICDGRAHPNSGKRYWPCEGVEFGCHLGLAPTGLAKTPHASAREPGDAHVRHGAMIDCKTWTDNGLPVSWRGDGLGSG